MVIQNSFIPLLHETIQYLAANAQLDFNYSADNLNSMILNSNLNATPGATSHGLTTTFYRDSNFEHRIHRATFKDLNISAHTSPFLQHYDGAELGIRWEGTMIPNESGFYTLTAKGNGEVNVWLDNKFLFQHKESKTSLDAGKANVVLDKDKAYSLRVEYSAKDNYSTQLYWDNGSGRKLVPHEVFSRSDLSVSSSKNAVLVGNAGNKQDVMIIQKRNQLHAVITTTLPGLYKLHLSKEHRKLCHTSVASDGTIPITVIEDPAESSMELIPSSEIIRLREHIDILETHDLNEIEKILSGAATGREFWDMLIIGAFFLLMTELILTRWIALQRKTGEKIGIDVNDHKGPSKSFLQQLDLITAWKKR